MNRSWDTVSRTSRFTRLRVRAFITRRASRVDVPRLDGRVALVTGGSGGIGRAAALELAKEGANVAVQYNRGKEAALAVAQTIQGIGRKGIAIQADVTDPRACRG